MIQFSKLYHFHRDRAPQIGQIYATFTPGFVGVFEGQWGALFVKLSWVNRRECLTVPKILAKNLLTFTVIRVIIVPMPLAIYVRCHHYGHGESGPARGKIRMVQ